MTDRLLDEMEITSLFETVVMSIDHGHQKPNAKILADSLSELDVLLTDHVPTTTPFAMAS